MIVKRKLYSFVDEESNFEQREFAKKDYQFVKGGVDYADDEFRRQVGEARSKKAARLWERRKKAIANANKSMDEFLKNHPDQPSFVRKIEVENAKRKVLNDYKRHGGSSKIRKRAIDDLIDRIEGKQLDRAANRAKVDLYSPAHHGNTGSARLERINYLRKANNKSTINTREELNNLIDSQKSKRTIPTPQPTHQSVTASKIPQISNSKPNVSSGSVFNKSFNPMKWSKGAKIGAGIAAGAAALGTGAYLYNKNKNKNSNSK